jgi:hypothetical protein
MLQTRGTEAWACELGFIQKQTFEKTGFRIFCKKVNKSKKNIYTYFKTCI